MGVINYLWEPLLAPLIVGLLLCCFNYWLNNK